MNGRDITMDIHMNDSGFFDRLNKNGPTASHQQPNPHFANEYDKLFHTKDAGKVDFKKRKDSSSKKRSKVSFADQNEEERPQTRQQHTLHKLDPESSKLGLPTIAIFVAN